MIQLCTELIQLRMNMCVNISSFFLFLFSIFPEGLMSYSIPKGVQRGIEVDLSDKTYDGVEEGERLIGGLGQLVDGQKGTDNFRSDIHGYGKGKKFFIIYSIKFV